MRSTPAASGNDYPFESARSEQCRVGGIAPVRRCHHDDAAALIGDPSAHTSAVACLLGGARKGRVLVSTVFG
jgi:hypothetical protein